MKENVKFKQTFIIKPKTSEPWERRIPPALELPGAARPLSAGRGTSVGSFESAELVPDLVAHTRKAGVWVMVTRSPSWLPPSGPLRAKEVKIALQPSATGESKGGRWKDPHGQLVLGTCLLVLISFILSLVGT